MLRFAFICRCMKNCILSVNFLREKNVAMEYQQRFNSSVSLRLSLCLYIDQDRCMVNIKNNLEVQIFGSKKISAFLYL